MSSPSDVTKRMRADLQGCPEARGRGEGMVHIGTVERLYLCTNCVARISARVFGYFGRDWAFAVEQLDAGRSRTPYARRVHCAQKRGQNLARPGQGVESPGSPQHLGCTFQAASANRGQE